MNNLVVSVEDTTVNSSCLSDISGLSNRSNFQVGNENIPLKATFEINKRYRVILTNVRGKNLKEKSGT